jgi:hypothetical protein
VLKKLSGACRSRFKAARWISREPIMVMVAWQTISAVRISRSGTYADEVEREKEERLPDTETGVDGHLRDMRGRAGIHTP